MDINGIKTKGETLLCIDEGWQFIEAEKKEREVELKFLGELIRIKNSGSFTDYGLLGNDRKSLFLEEKIKELNNAFDVHKEKVNKIIDEVISHLNQ